MSGRGRERSKTSRGITAPYETPANPELVIDTGVLSVDQSLAILDNHVERWLLYDRDGPIEGRAASG